MSIAWKPNSLPLDVVLIKPLILLEYQKLLLLQIQSTLPKEFLIHCCTHFKFMLYLFFVNFEISLCEIKKIQLNSGSAQVNATSYFIKWLIRKLNHLILFLTICANYCGTSARKKNAMIFQASDLKGQQFLELHNNNNNLIEPSYVKGGSWLKFFGHLNSLCARVTRAITNHAPIGEYRLRFFPQESFNCLCSSYPIKMRHHILHECRRYNECWNPRRDTISYFILFLEFNSNVFAFSSAIT